jgi:glycosyltransferase involved in cell wall biosynthesis
MAKEKVSVVIPAFNEERQIEGVIKSIQKSPLVDEIIVVDDGSTDKTSEVAKCTGARVITKENGGKGSAMARGIKDAKSEIIVFLDADLLGFTKEHLRDLLSPLKEKSVAMTVASFRGGNMVTFIGQTMAPALSGQRAIRKKYFTNLSIKDSGYGVELALNKYAKDNQLKVEKVKIHGVNQVIAEKKVGINGASLRVKKYLDIAKQSGRKPQP